MICKFCCSNYGTTNGKIQIIIFCNGRSLPKTIDYAQKTISVYSIVFINLCTSHIDVLAESERKSLSANETERQNAMQLQQMHSECDGMRRKLTQLTNENAKLDQSLAELRSENERLIESNKRYVRR